MPGLGSEEEVEFMAALAAKEVEGCDVDALDYPIRSHMLLEVLRLAFLHGLQREELCARIKQGTVVVGRLDETTVDEWIEKELEVMDPYVLEKKVFPVADQQRTELFRRILAENGQLFARGG